MCQPVRKLSCLCIYGLLLFTLFIIPLRLSAQTLRVASKNFVENYILAELMAQLLENHDFKVERRYNLGGTLICYQALQSKQIDIYPEYTGTIQEAILKSKQSLSFSQLNQSLARHGIRAVASFGFNNTYALALSQDGFKKFGFHKISDLARYKNGALRIALSYELLKRHDGWEALRHFYKIKQSAYGIEHGLAYEAISSNQVDLIDVYSTDAEIKRYQLHLLEDDKHFFPEYLAVPLASVDLPAQAFVALQKLAGRIHKHDMQKLNMQVSVHKKSYQEVAQKWLIKNKLLSQTQKTKMEGETLWQRLYRRTLRHIQLTGLSLLVAFLLALPLGILIYKLNYTSSIILYIAGLLQTIPSIALLALMLPLLGIGVTPAIVALVLYAILPILRSTVTALRGIEPLLLEAAQAMQLTSFQRLVYVELPLSMPVIFAGLRTAAVICVGTATLAAFIGAGGLGEPIVTGLALNDPKIILEGTLPAAALAIVIDLFFDGLQRFVVPAHLRAT